MYAPTLCVVIRTTIKISSKALVLTNQKCLFLEYRTRVHSVHCVSKPCIVLLSMNFLLFRFNAKSRSSSNVCLMQHNCRKYPSHVWEREDANAAWRGVVRFIFELIFSSLYKSSDKKISFESTANISEINAFNLVLAGVSNVTCRVRCELFHMEFRLKSDFEFVQTK